jgi:NAD-dependent dihydropyrimidine dehydrogenase PreA subunit
MPINDTKRLKAVCVGTCPWYIWASTDSRTEAWQIKRYTSEHTCSSGRWKISAFTAKFIAEKYLESFRADQGMSLKNFSRVVQKEWNMTPSRSKLQRAKRIAMKVIYGDEEEQYNMLWDYANEIKRSNPGSTFWLAVDQNSRFKQCYMSIEACKRGFLEGCRPVIFIDGCFLKTRYRGQLLTAVGMDPNDCIFPIAVAAVEVEDTTSWTWFLETLKSDLGIINTTPWTIMSDRQKVLAFIVTFEFNSSYLLTMY